MSKDDNNILNHPLASYVKSKNENNSDSDTEYHLFSNSDFENEIADILEKMDNEKLLTIPKLERQKAYCVCSNCPGNKEKNEIK